MQTYNVAVVGATGAVGEVILDILAQRNFPVEQMFALASERSAGDTVMFNDKPVLVENLAEFVGHYFTAVGDVATAFRPLSFGLVIVLFLMFEPRGIANWLRITRSYFKLWPFRY